MIVKSKDAQMREFLGIRFELLAVGPRSMVCKMLYKPRDSAPMHAHPNEQSGYVISGRYRLRMGGQNAIIEKGDSYAIPENMEHGLDVLEAGEVIDVFTPIREDYLSPND